MGLTNTKQQGIDGGIKIVVYGPAGVGKTRLMATTPDHSRTLILSAEAGLLSISEHEIDVWKITSKEDIREAYRFARANIERYDWICVDSLSEIAEVVLSHEKESANDPRRAYGEMADVLFKFVRSMRNLQSNVIFSSKQERINDEGRLVYAPMLPGKQLSANLPYLIDELWAMRAEVVEGERRVFLQTQSCALYDAKDRSGRLRMYERPNLADLANKIINRNEGA